MRGSPLATFIQTLTREERLIRLPLARLDPDEVKHLAGQWAASRVAEPNQIAALADWLRSASEGNPYVLVELLRYACDQGLLRAGWPAGPGRAWAAGRCCRRPFSA